MKALLRLLLVLLLASVASPARAEANDPALAGKKLARRKARLAVRKGWVVMSVGWRDVVNSKIKDKLLSGLPTVIATRAYLFSESGDDKPVSLSIKTCRVVFDLWDEVFRIELVEAGRQRRTVAVNVEGVLRRCAEAKHLPLALASSLSARERYFAGVIVEVNPLSKEMVDRIKRWVARPKGAGAVSPGDSLFGSFVGLFITHVPAADRTVSFRTQSFVVNALPEIITPEEKKAWLEKHAPFGMRSARERVESGGSDEKQRLESVYDDPDDEDDGDELSTDRAERPRPPSRRDWR